MKTSKLILWLAASIVVLALLATSAGLFLQTPGEPSTFTTLRGESVLLYGHGLYRYDTISYAAQAIAQDAVTLFLGIPLLVISMYLSRKGSLRGRLLLAGALGYFLYTYASMVFLAAYNAMFLVYVALFSLSLFAFILTMARIDPAGLIQHVSPRFPRRGIAAFFALIGAFLAWLGRIVPALLAGVPPYGLEAYTTLVIQALDLGIIVPTALVTAILLWQKRPWGYALASVVLAKASLMGVALVAMIIGQLLAGVSVSLVEAGIFSLIPVAGIGLTVLMLRSVQDGIELPARASMAQISTSL
jgi:hypothetical protein